MMPHPPSRIQWMGTVWLRDGVSQSLESMFDSSDRMEVLSSDDGFSVGVSTMTVDEGAIRKMTPHPMV